MDRIEIRVEFRTKTVAGLTDCKADKIFPIEIAKDSAKDVVAYVQRIVRSEARDVAVTFAYKRGSQAVETSRIWYYTPELVNIVKWERWNSRDGYTTEKLTAKEIRDLYLECVKKYEED